LQILVDAVIYRHSQASQHDGDQPVMCEVTKIPQRGRFRTYPPVLVPPIMSKTSHGFLPECL
jgi:hypothetical protein